MKSALVFALVLSLAVLSLALPVVHQNEQVANVLESLMESVTPTAGSADLQVQRTGKLPRYVRLQAARAYFQVSYVAVYTPDGAVVSAGKPVSSNCDVCHGPAAPGVITTGVAEARAHPGEWHATTNLDWIEIDLGVPVHVSKVVFYNRAECCQERSIDAALTLLDANRAVVDSAILTGAMMQTFNFVTCDLDMSTASYTNNHAESASPILALLCGLQMKIKGTVLTGAANVAAAKVVKEDRGKDVTAANTNYGLAETAYTTASNDNSAANIQRNRELQMIDNMVAMIHALNGKGLGNNALAPIVDISQLVGRISGTYWVKPAGEPNAVQLLHDNDRNGGGWVLAATVTRASCQAHMMTRDAIGTAAPSKTDTVTTKKSDAFIDKLRASSTSTGTIGYWMEATTGFSAGAKNVYISSSATMNSMASATDMPQRCNVAISYSANQALEMQGPNTGTRGFGHHHTGNGIFAWGRHPEEGNNCGFRADSMGASDGFLWVR
jgi:hypothetical protein